MKRAPLLALVAAASVALATPAVAADEPTTDGPTASYIVQFTPGSDRSAEVAKAKALGMTVTYEYAKVLNGMAVLANKGQLTALEKNPNVRLIEADGIASISATQDGATWGLDRTDQRDLPLSTTYTYETTASNVTAYIIDTGINASHQEFGGRVSGGFTAFTDSVGTGDCNGHGTHVAGTVAGATYGMAKAAKLVPVRVLDCAGSGAWSGVIAGVDWVAANAVKPAVANMSLGGGAFSSLDTAVSNAVASGVTMVVAAGNSNANACNYSPARAASAITVGSTTTTDARSSFSNFGTCVDIFAPGSNITSAWHTGTSALNTISGTSMASPHVAGAAALYLAGDPTASPATVTSALNTAATLNKVTSAGTGSPNRLLFVGATTPPPPAAKPAISGFTPDRGSAGTSVTISGSDLSGATVSFNGTAATVTSTSGTSVTATVPAGATSGTISVTTAGGTTASAATFTVTVPPTAPASLTRGTITQTTATVSWSAPSSLGTGTFQRYEVRLGSGAWTLTGGTAATQFTSLRRNTTYSWSVRAVTTDGPGASASGTFRTAR